MAQLQAMYDQLDDLQEQITAMQIDMLNMMKHQEYILSIFF